VSYFRTDFEPSKEDNDLSGKLYIPTELHVKRLNTAIELYSQHIPKVTVLDVGCGFGHLYERIRETTSHYRGIDPDTRAIAFATGKYGAGLFEVGGVETLKPKMAADVVFCLGVAALLKKSPEALNWLIEELAHVAKKAVIIEFQDSNRYNGHFTSFSQDEVSKACQRVFNRRTFLQREDDSTFCVRIPLV
jgi:SAM-dependent methyltransferase